MEYRWLGRTGLKVSAFCLGTMTFGRQFYDIGVLGSKEGGELVAAALDAGVNFFDTADAYSFGQSEEILGKALRASGSGRDDVVIATKVRGPMTAAAIEGSGDFNRVGLSRKHILSSCDGSLKRLQTDYIDLYQIHGWDIRTPMEESLRTFEDLVRQGKVRYIGCSNWAARHLARALCVCECREWDRFVSLQAYYSLVGRDVEYELLPLCREEGLGFLVWSPLAGGFLSGKYRRDHAQASEGRRKTLNFPPLNQDLGFQAVELLSEVADETQSTIAQAALAWLLAQPGVTSVILGANRLSQIEENLAALQVQLSAVHLERLSALTAPPELYPQWVVEWQNRGR